MTEIIKIEERNGAQAVSARDLHDALELRRISLLGLKREFPSMDSLRIRTLRFSPNLGKTQMEEDQLLSMLYL